MARLTVAHPVEAPEWFHSTVRQQTDGLIMGRPWRIWVDEAAETELGTEVLMGLSRRFEAIGGVVEVMQEDREIFYVKAPGMDPVDLESKAREIVYGLHAARKQREKTSD